ncbi:hypothetical protein [Arthrobacter sunyaminii]|uniref:Uncharacterized protein n=1 Tax=Arthrobacter sunyaminii TaxID=2816859 RepID=A0A975S3W3_9MICC|nr:hypothetical protein [Arthrobacter sunyaminii]MBO0907473.1 hypothetical protein [Arthrobacter sunyaminii]QWQ35050.1 hypothetical protein KG104_10995 [Arthrobacter sunyaminii]
MIKREKRRFNWLLAAIAASIAGGVAMFWQSGTCTDFVAVAGECSLGPSLSTIIVAVVLWGLAVGLLCVWWSEDRRA